MKGRSKQSAGVLMFRRKQGAVEVFLVHMGGPFWQHKDEGSWSIPKGEFEEGEAPLAAAKREFEEETGVTPQGEFIELQPVKQSSGKVVFAWAVEGDCDATKIRSNNFTMEWPKGSGLMREFPEVDRAEWFPLAGARRKILKGQVPLLEQLAAALGLTGLESI
jgi:predicted NUDIX family NTP pyrophosphohydrolase